MRLSFNTPAYYTSPKLDGRMGYIYITGYKVHMILDGQGNEMITRHNSFSDILLQAEFMDRGTYYEVVVIDVLRCTASDGYGDISLASFESRLNWMTEYGDCLLQNYSKKHNAFMFSKEGCVFTSYMSNIQLYAPGNYKNVAIGSPTFYVKIYRDIKYTKSVIDFCVTRVNLLTGGDYETYQQEVQVVFDDSGTVAFWRRVRPDREISSAFKRGETPVGYDKLHQIFCDLGTTAYIPPSYRSYGEKRHYMQILHFRKIIDSFLGGVDVIGDLKKMREGCAGHDFMSQPEDCDVCKMAQNMKIYQFRDTGGVG